MSYILEALKKSQQERGRGQLPDWQTLHQPVAAPDAVAPRWLYAALIICLLALAFLLGWLRPWQSERAAESNVEVVPPAMVVAPVKAPVVQPEMSLPLPEKKPQPEQRINGTKQEQAVSAISAVPETVEDIEQLPALLRQSIPELNFAGHVYSANPAQRSVIINGRAMGEGDALMPGMLLRQITADSVIFEYEQRVFRVKVLQDWSFK